MENIASDQINVDSLRIIHDENRMAETPDKATKSNNIDSNIKFSKLETNMGKKNCLSKSINKSNSSPNSTGSNGNQKENVLPKSIIKTPPKVRTKLTPELIRFETPKMPRPYYQKFKEQLLLAPKCNRRLRRYSTNNPNDIILENGDDQLLRTNRPSSLCRILFNSPELPITGDSPQQ